MRRMVMRMPLFLTQEGFYFSQVAMLSFVLRSLPFAGDRRVGHLQGCDGRVGHLQGFHRMVGHLQGCDRRVGHLQGCDRRVGHLQGCDRRVGHLQGCVGDCRPTSSGLHAWLQRPDVSKVILAGGPGLDGTE